MRRIIAFLCLLVALPDLVIHADEPARKDKSAKDYQERGDAMLARGDVEQALAAFNEAIKRDPKLIAAYRGRALLHLRKGELDKALADLEEAIRVDPKNARLYLARAVIHVR